MIASLLTFFIVGLVAIIGLSLILGFIGIFFKLAFGLAGFLLFKIVPVVLLGYLIVRFLAPRRPREPEAESTASPKA